MSLNAKEYSALENLLEKVDPEQFIQLLDDAERCVFCGHLEKDPDNSSCRCPVKRPKSNVET